MPSWRLEDRRTKIKKNQTPMKWTRPGRRRGRQRDQHRIEAMPSRYQHLKCCIIKCSSIWHAAMHSALLVIDTPVRFNCIKIALNSMSFCARSLRHTNTVPMRCGQTQHEKMQILKICCRNGRKKIFLSHNAKERQQAKCQVPVLMSAVFAFSHLSFLSSPAESS